MAAAAQTVLEDQSALKGEFTTQAEILSTAEPGGRARAEPRQGDGKPLALQLFIHEVNYFRS